MSGDSSPHWHRAGSPSLISSGPLVLIYSAKRSTLSPTTAAQGQGVRHGPHTTKGALETGRGSVVAKHPPTKTRQTQPKILLAIMQLVGWCAHCSSIVTSCTILSSESRHRVRAKCFGACASSEKEGRLQAVLFPVEYRDGWAHSRPYLQSHEPHALEQLNY